MFDMLHAANKYLGFRSCFFNKKNLINRMLFKICAIYIVDIIKCDFYFMLKII